MLPLSSSWATARFGKSCASSGNRGVLVLGGLLLTLDFLAVEFHEIDCLEVERRETAIARDIRDDAPQEREELARALDQKEGVKLVIGDTLDVEQADIVDFQQKKPLFGLGLVDRGHHERDRGFVLVF